VERPTEDPPLRGIILFDSIHDVLAAEQVLKECRLWCDLVPAPRDLKADCGMVVEFLEPDLVAVRSALIDGAVRPGRFYRRLASAYEEIGKHAENG
jgi:hypothetical protein